MAEEMASFFDKRAVGYDEHMKQFLTFNYLYKSAVHGIKKTDKGIKILDLGCGTGIELKGILKKAPNAQITCIDLSFEMLEILKKKYEKNIKQFNVIQGSYLDIPFEENYYDYVISFQTMHHFLENTKVKLYEKIRNALKPNGVYIEADYIVDEHEEKIYLEKYNKLKEDKDSKLYHIDIPFSVKTQKKLLCYAGFKFAEVIYEDYHGAVLFSSNEKIHKPDRTIVRFIEELEDKLFDYWKTIEKDVDKEQLIKSLLDNEKVFNQLQQFVALDKDKIVGFVQYGRPSDNVGIGVMRHLYFDPRYPDAGQQLVCVAMDYFSRFDNKDGIYAYYTQYNSMNHVEQLLIDNDFKIVDENQGVAKK